MRRSVILLALLALSACQVGEKPPHETTSTTTATGPQPPRERMLGTVGPFSTQSPDAGAPLPDGAIGLGAG